VPRVCEFYPGICLTTEEKARKIFSQGKKNLSQVNKSLSQCTVYILPKHPHITKPTQTHTLEGKLNTALKLLLYVDDEFLKEFINTLTLRRLMSNIYGAPILDVSRSHTTTQHSR